MTIEAIFSLAIWKLLWHDRQQRRKKKTKTKKEKSGIRQKEKEIRRGLLKFRRPILFGKLSVLLKIHTVEVSLCATPLCVQIYSYGNYISIS